MTIVAYGLGIAAASGATVVRNVTATLGSRATTATLADHSLVANLTDRRNTVTLTPDIAATVRSHALSAAEGRRFTITLTSRRFTT